MNPLVSVIIPVYKVEQYLKKCIDSIINQTYKNLEIILVDDGSPDDCPAICDEYAKNDSRIKVIHKKNGGLSDARNAGMAIAKGDYISFIDSDDWIDLSMFEIMVSRLIKDHSDVVSCGVKWVEEDGTLIREVSNNKYELLSNYQAVSEIIIDGKLKQHVWNKIYRADLVRNIHFEKGKYHEDVYWSYQIFGLANKISIVSESYYYYVQRPNSIMGEEYSFKRIDALDAMRNRCDYIKHNYPDLYNLSLNTYLSSCMYHLQLAMNANSKKQIIGDIVSRLSYKKTGNIFACISGKSALWMRMFLIAPKATCALRNKLKVGL